MLKVRTVVFPLLLILFAAAAAAQTTGRISGRVVRDTGSGIGGVIVVVNEISDATTTDANGSFSFDSVPAGNYNLTFTAGDKVETAAVTVAGGQTATVEKRVDWQMNFAESITVYSASRQTERIVEAPAAVSVVSEEDRELASATGQLPKVLESAPGVDFTQSGVYDFNFNARGFNSSLNRRILTLIDGRDPAVPFLGAQEWAALSYPIDEMASVELVRGPGSALYGANAFNGVLNMVTKQPRFSPGGKVQITGGDLSTARADLRYAATLGENWGFRLVGGYQQSDDFTTSRNTQVEYSHFCSAVETQNCLRREAVPLRVEEDKIMFAGLRLDRYFASGPVLTLEAGGASLEGPTFQTGIGRVQVTDVTRPWARINFSTTHWNALAYYDARDANAQVALASGAELYEDSSNKHAEIQTNWTFAKDRVRIIAGGAYHLQDVDTSNPQGIHTLMADSHEEDQQAVFGQLEINFTEKLRGVLAGRYDESSLHDPKTSPKAALVYSFTPSQSIRLNYSQAFQVPNYSEFFLTAPAAAPITALSALENALRPLLGGVSLGFGSIPVLARGNSELVPEDITSYEIGYSGILGGKLYMTADYYQNKVENFVTDLLPGVNSQFPRYAPPGALPLGVQQTILAQLRANLPASVFAGMTNLPNGNPAIVFSYANAGNVDTQGVELAFNYYLTNNWVVDANYSWFDFEVEEGTQAIGDQLFPNAPENKYNLGFGYRSSRLDASLKYRVVEGFFWAAGVFQGEVPDYDVINLAANFKVMDNISIGANISNVADNDHYETFGGDILERRALAFLSFTF